jgi:hypothetical protein
MSHPKATVAYLRGCSESRVRPEVVTFISYPGEYKCQVSRRIDLECQVLREQARSRCPKVFGNWLFGCSTICQSVTFSACVH